MQPYERWRNEGIGRIGEIAIDRAAQEPAIARRIKPASDGAFGDRRDTRYVRCPLKSRLCCTAIGTAAAPTKAIASAAPVAPKRTALASLAIALIRPGRAVRTVTAAAWRTGLTSYARTAIRSVAAVPIIASSTVRTLVLPRLTALIVTRFVSIVGARFTALIGPRLTPLIIPRLTALIQSGVGSAITAAVVTRSASKVRSILTVRPVQTLDSFETLGETLRAAV